MINTCRQGRYRIEKTVFTHPAGMPFCSVTRFAPMKGGKRLPPLRPAAPRTWGIAGAETPPGSATIRGCRCSSPSAGAMPGAGLLGPLGRGSAGYVGTSDGWRDLARHRRLTWTYERAEDGNVVLTGEVDVVACDGQFVLALAFGS